MIATCVMCGGIFVPKNKRKPAKTCSRTCTNLMVWRDKPTRKKGGPAPRPRVIADCLTCGKPVKWAQRPGRQGIYCSQRCVGLAKGRSAIYISPKGRARINLRDGSKQWYARCLMEGHLKRHLGPNEIVHHINGDCSDDRIENLEVVTKEEHARLHEAQRTQRKREASKLKPADVAYILRSSERAVDLARRYGVTEGAISYHRKRGLKSHGRAG